MGDPEATKSSLPKLPTTTQGIGGIAALVLFLLPLVGVAAGVALLTSPYWWVESVVPTTPWRALPPAGQRLERIAFGSCLQQSRPQPIWQAVIAAKPDLFLMTGDGVYGDLSGARLAPLRAAYAGQLRHPEFQRARAALPFLATWDDHDFGLNDGGGDFPHKAATQQLFHEFWQTKPQASGGQGVYAAHVFGPPGERVQIILLDTRYFRSPLRRRTTGEPRRSLPSGGARPGQPSPSRAPAPANVPTVGPYAPDPAPAKTMLGAAQWAWLEAELRKPAEIRILVSSIQVLADTHGWERWGNLPRERDRLFDVIRRSGARGVIMVSGDRHRGAMYVKDSGADYLLIEATSSALNLTIPGGTDPPDPARQREAMVDRDNFGLLRIDWTAKRFALSLNGVDGRALEDLEMPFDALGLR